MGSICKANRLRLSKGYSLHPSRRSSWKTYSPAWAALSRSAPPPCLSTVSGISGTLPHGRNLSKQNEPRKSHSAGLLGAFAADPSEATRLPRSRSLRLHRVIVSKGRVVNYCCCGTARARVNTVGPIHRPQEWRQIQWHFMDASGYLTALGSETAPHCFCNRPRDRPFHPGPRLLMTGEATGCKRLSVLSIPGGIYTNSEMWATQRVTGHSSPLTWLIRSIYSFQLFALPCPIRFNLCFPCLITNQEARVYERLYVLCINLRKDSWHSRNE